MSYLPGKFTWFEHLSSDPAKAKAFYEGLFGWQVRPVTMSDGAAHDNAERLFAQLALALALSSLLPARWFSALYL